MLPKAYPALGHGVVSAFTFQEAASFLEGRLSVRRGRRRGRFSCAAGERLCGAEMVADDDCDGTWIR